MEAVFKLADQYKTELSDDYTMLRIQARLLRTELENQVLITTKKSNAFAGEQ